MVLDLGAGERRKIARRDIGPALVRPAVRIAEMAVREAQPFGIFVHHIGKGFLGTGNALCEDDGSIISRQSDDAVEEVFNADLLVGA